MSRYEITSFLNWEPWIKELLISTSCGDQCHCLEVGCRKLGRVVWPISMVWSVSGVIGWQFGVLEESEQYGDWMRWVMIINSYAIWGNMAWHLSKLIHKVFLKAIECVAVCWSRGFKIVWGKYVWREKNVWMHVVHTKSSKYFLFKLRVILKYVVFVHCVMGQILIIICVCSCCSEEPVKWKKISYGRSIGVSEYKYGCMCEFFEWWYCKYKHVSRLHANSNCMVLKIFVRFEPKW